MFRRAHDLAAAAGFSRPVLNNATGTYFVHVSAPGYQEGPNGLEILIPSEPEATAAIVLALPGAGGTSTKRYGSAIQLIRAASWHDHHNCCHASVLLDALVADRGGAVNSSGAPVRQEAYLLEVILP